MRVSEFMRDFDKLRSGSITETQFLSCLSMMKIYLSQKESEMLTDKYRNPEKEKEILWRDFCDDIDNVFVVKKLEKRNDINELLSITKSSFKLNELSLPDQAILQEILKEMKGFFEVNRIDPKPAFTNYDHLKRGKVLKPQFKKICHSMKFFISESDIEILMKKYGDPISNEINYIVILNESNEIGVGKKVSQENEENEKKREEIMPSLSSSNNFYTYQTHFLNINFHVNDILDKIKHFIKINRIRLQQFFDDFDSLRKGNVSKAKFRTALNMAK